MTSHLSHRPVSALRARMIEDMRVRGFTEKTRNDYIRNVRAFAAFIGRSPGTATAEDLRRFQLHQTQTGMQPPSINSAVAALRFFFTVTLDRPDLARRLTIVREPRRLPAVLSVEESHCCSRRRAEVQGGARHRIWHRTARLRGRCAQGRRYRSERMLLRVEQGKGRKDRNAMLSPLELLRAWWRGGSVPGRVAAARLAVSGPQSGRAALDPPAQPRRPCRRRGRRDQEASVAAHAAAQLRHASAGTGHQDPEMLWASDERTASSSLQQTDGMPHATAK
jgi:Phage integrase, N-terminal SAM-like domain